MPHHQDDSLATVTQLNQRDAAGNTPLIRAIHHAFCQPSSAAMRQALALIMNPAVDVSIADKNGKTALYYARLYSKTLLVAAIEERLEKERLMRFWGSLWQHTYRPTPDQIPSANFDRQDHSGFDL